MLARSVIWWVNITFMYHSFLESMHTSPQSHHTTKPLNQLTRWTRVIKEEKVEWTQVNNHEWLLSLMTLWRGQSEKWNTDQKWHFLWEELLTTSNQEVKRTKVVQSEPDPAVVFFPTNQDSECMDATTGIVKTKRIIIFFSYHMKEWNPISVWHKKMQNSSSSLTFISAVCVEE